MSKNKSGLMYLCGHPGTGKTSLLNQVLAKVKGYELFMYNAMTYQDVRSFCLTLHADLIERFTGQETQRLNR